MGQARALDARLPFWVALVTIIGIATQQARAQSTVPLGPVVVRFTSDYVQVDPAAESVKLELELVGRAPGTVTASLGVFLQGLKAGIPRLAAEWAANSNGSRTVVLPSSGIAALLGAKQRSAVVRLMEVTAGAAVDATKAAAVLSLDADLPQFSFRPNVAAYPGDRPTVEITLAKGRVAQPATLRYNMVPLTSAARPFVRTAAAAGFLQLAPGAEGANVTLPVEWDAVPPEAEYRLGMQLDGFLNAWTAAQSGDVAVHVFGVKTGTCPPGAAATTGGPAARTNTTVNATLTGAARRVQTLPWGSGRGDASLTLTAAKAAVVLYKREQQGLGVVEIGGMVAPNVTAAMLCVWGAEAQVAAGAAGGGRFKAANASAAQAGCAGAAWELQLAPGANQYVISDATKNASASSSSSSPTSSEHVVVLSVVRLADARHARLSALQAKDLQGRAVVVCGPPAEAVDGDVGAAEDLAYRYVDTKAEAAAVEVLSAWKACSPGVPMAVSVPAYMDTLRIAPSLLFPGVPGVRVEINGQVLSRGGNVEADQVEDTGAAAGDQGIAAPSGVLPAAYVVGMQPGVAVDLDVVVIAEDGVTSASYPVRVTREHGLVGISEEELVLGVAAAAAVGNVAYGSSDAVQREPDWPLPPAKQGKCKVCPAGWASTVVNAPVCEMCPPGTAAPKEGSAACAPCATGTYSLSWGSSHCKHCIAGTHAPVARATSCRMCPEGTTTAEDGQAVCNMTVAPGTDLQLRYAVVVYFSVNLTGSDPEAIVLKTGVNASAVEIVGNLLRTDTAAAFNISTEDVEVLSVHHVARRTLQANVSATLGVDLPVDATEEDIAAALEVQKLSADRPIEMLSQDPDSFFGRTTKTLDVGVEAVETATVESRPLQVPPFSRWILVAPGVVGLLLGAGMVASSWWRGGGQGSGGVRRWAQTLRVAPAATRYARERSPA